MPARQRIYRDALGASPLELPPGAAWHRRPRPEHWQGITRLARQIAKQQGLRVPVRITHGRTPARFGSCVGLAFLNCSNGAAISARIWVSKDLARSAAIDTLLHELAHVLHDQELGRKATAVELVNDAAAHPARFWVIYGELYNAWMAAYGN